MIASIKPEHLLDSDDYHYYMTSQQKNTTYDGESYELISRKAWTDLLLQILKVSFKLLHTHNCEYIL